MSAKRFRSVAVQTCSSKSYSFRKWREDGLDELLETADDENWKPQEIAVQVLGQFCVTNGRFNNFMVGFLAVMTYLNEQCGTRGEQTWRDLVQVLNGGGNLAAIRKWAEAHFA